MKICKVSTDDNVADPLTKAFAQAKHDHHIKSMGIRYMYDLAECKWEIVSDCTLRQLLDIVIYIIQRPFYYIVYMFVL